MLNGEKGKVVSVIFRKYDVQKGSYPYGNKIIHRIILQGLTDKRHVFSGKLSAILVYSSTEHW